MGITIIGNESGAIPHTFTAPIIETSLDTIFPASDADWSYDATIELESCSLHASSSAVSTCEISRRYGILKRPYTEHIAQSDSEDLVGCWVRISFVNGEDIISVFVGQILDEAKQLMGSDDVDAGRQVWTAHGGLKVLQRMTISESFFLDADGNKLRIGWIPSMNRHDKRGLLVGNAQDDGSGNIYYGGHNVWTHLDYLYYLVANFFQQPGGPNWTVGGQTDILADMKTTVVFQEAMTAADMLRALIPVRYGVDFQILHTSGGIDGDGYEINIFALSDIEATFGDDVKMPKNPNTVTVKRQADSIELVDVHIVESSVRKVDRVVVLGKRIVVCGTLAAAGARFTSPFKLGSLVPRWSSTLEADYINAAGETDPDEADAIRKREKYRDVYQHYGAPANWDLDGGRFAVTCDDNGVITNINTGEGSNSAAITFQTSIRETLSWIPLKEGWDYSTDPETDNTESGGDVVSDVKPPMAWIYNADPEDGSSPRNVPAEHMHLHAHHPFMDWGIFISASPNHRLALNHWTDDQLATTNIDTDKMLDYNTLVTTIAIESDHRLQLGYELEGDLAAGDGSVMTIVDEQAECWVLLPYTAVDVDENGVILNSGDELRVLRDDTNRLALVMAGEICRYINERVRASLSFKGFLPWDSLLGSILTVIQDGSSVTSVGAPVTSVEWVLKPTPMTYVKTGYA